MKQLTSIAFCFIIFIQGALGQALTLKPFFSTADKEIEIIINLKNVKDGRAAGLLNKTSDVFLWAWGGTDATNKKSEFGPDGQTSFSQPFDAGKMTALGNDRWSIKLTPSKYLKIPAGKIVGWMGCLLKNGAGTSQTEDFTFDLYDSKLNTAFVLPNEKQFFAEANTKFQVFGRASQTANLSIRLDGVLQKSSNADSILTEINTGNLAGTKRTISLTAQTATETSNSEINFTVKPQSTIAEVPTGIKNGINYISDTQVTLSLFAPNKSFVYLLGEFNNWQISPEFLMKKSPDGNRYWLEIKNLLKGQEYAFQYLVDGIIPIAEPFAEKLLDRNNDGFITASTYPNLKKFPTGALGNFVSVLQTSQTPYNWKVKNFNRPVQTNLTVYELLVRDFSAAGTYKAVADSVGYFKKMGINCLQLMPIMEFTGNDSWGYNPIFYTAPDKAYGPNTELKALIDKCHENGISVVLDMVLNQADYEFPYVKMYWDGSQPSLDSPMFNQQATHPFSVFFDFNHESLATKELTDRVCQFWLQEYKFDGFRFDLAKGFTQTKSVDDGVFRRFDASRVAIWKRIYDKIRSYDPSAYVILELFSEDSEEQDLTNYGMMTWGNQNGDFRNLIKGTNSNFGRISHKERGFSKPHLVGYMESHDEQRMMWEALNNGREVNGYSAKNLTNAANRAKALVAVGLLVPGPKMVWQFGEIGYDISIDENGRTGRKPIKTDYTTNIDRGNLSKVYAEILKLKTTVPAFQSTTFTLNASTLKKSLLIEHPTMQVLVVANMDMEDMIDKTGFIQAGTWYDYFTGQELSISNLDEKTVLKPGEFHIYTTQKLTVPQLNLVPWAAYTKAIILGQEPKLESKLIAYPNPSDEFVNLIIEDTFRGNIHIKVQNIMGQSIDNLTFNKNTERQNFEINVSKIPTGMYLLDIQSKDRRVMKLIKK